MSQNVGSIGDNPAVRAVAYTVYNIGPQILAGLVRTIVSAMFIFKHCYYANTLNQALNESARARDKDEKGTENAFLRRLKHFKNKIVNMAEAGAVKLGSHITDNKTLKNEWVQELKRGLSEICIFGSFYRTYTDNFDKKYVSVLGIDEIIARIGREHRNDEDIQEFLPKELYDPII